jgi:hypothetical protein
MGLGWWGRGGAEAQRHSRMHSTPVVGIALSSVVDGISLSSVAVVAAVAAHLDLGLKATVSVDLMCALGS